MDSSVDKLLAFLYSWAIGRIFKIQKSKIQKSTITDTISRYKNSNKNFMNSKKHYKKNVEKIPSETYINLIESMPRKSEACIKIKDGQLNIKHLYNKI